jgi:CheY-like chemotaxis protein
MQETNQKLGTVGRRVLIVDDNVDAAVPLKEALEDVGHEVMLATDPVQALVQARTFAPEVCILDLQLPIMDGYELGLHLRGLSKASFIALTGYGHEHDQAKSRAAGFAAHLVKPVNLDQLISVIGALP